MMKRKGFTLIEVLIASFIMSMILITGMSVMQMMTATLYDGQTESHNRINLTDNIYYMTREIQSAESIHVSPDCKTLKIKQRGSSGYNLEYSIANGAPVGTLNFKSKAMLHLNYDQSKFELSGKMVKITLAVYKTNLDYKAKPQMVFFEALPRSSAIDLEVVE